MFECEVCKLPFKALDNKLEHMSVNHPNTKWSDISSRPVLGGTIDISTRPNEVILKNIPLEEGKQEKPIWECSCGYSSNGNYEEFITHKCLNKEAKRNPATYRYDILMPSFIEAMAKIADYGAEKYGDFNWTKSRLDGSKGPINHIYEHLNQYRQSRLYDHPEIGIERKYHLAAIAFNAMMEFWYEENPNL
jgi:dATP/dGTP diphosphohydrolase